MHLAQSTTMKILLMLCITIYDVVARSNDGFSSVSQTQDGQGGSRYEYDITDWDTNRKRWEETDADNNRRGGYQIVDVNGQVRQVEYEADKNGFRATIRTNEPGTKPGRVGGAVFISDVDDIIQSTRGVLQNTGHVQKQQKLGNYPDNIPVEPIKPVRAGANVIKHHAAQGPHFDAVRPIGHSPVAPQDLHVLSRPAITVQSRPAISVPGPALTVPSRPALTVPSRPENNVPSYSGPIRRKQIPVHDPSQSFEVPDTPSYPSRVPAYTPQFDGPTVPPPASRQRVAYQPASRVLAPAAAQPVILAVPAGHRREFSWSQGTDRNLPVW